MMSIEYMRKRIGELLMELETVKYTVYNLEGDIKAAEQTIDGLRNIIAQKDKQIAELADGDSLIDVDFG